MASIYGQGVKMARPRRTRTDAALEALAAAGYLAMVAVLVVHWSALPDRVPMRFDLSGNVIGEGRKGGLILLPVMMGWAYVVLTGVDAIPMSMRRYLGPRTASNWGRQAVLQRRCMLMLKALLMWALAMLTWDIIRVALHGGAGRAGIGVGLIGGIAALIVGWLWASWRLGRRAEA